MSSPSTRESFEALNAAIAGRMQSPRVAAELAPEHRASLVLFAESSVVHAKAGVAWVQARYIAGMLAVLDGGSAPSPFQDAELTRAYDDECRFGKSIEAAEPGVSPVRR